MLCLTRRPREAVLIKCPDGTKLEMTVLSVRGASVRLGFTAPNSYVIDRHEVHERKKDEAPPES
jgi:carbon storage regulator CsrA